MVVFGVADCYVRDMTSKSSARIDDEVFASAQIAGDVSGRSTAQQVSHWARIGRELERSRVVSAREVTEVLMGSYSYDDLDSKQQALVRAEWTEAMERRRANLDMTEVIAAEGFSSWAEADKFGNVVIKTAAGTVDRVGAPDGSRPRTRVATTATATGKSTDGGKVRRVQRTGGKVRVRTADGAIVDTRKQRQKS